ncbi:histidinol-phosphatase HisJ [Gracilibacillus sp. YIM 98692]|uniref:histidinol-phosphatase HisJ n=1 Tax=Gracilibacillus sp. YIM 98692 TaxID=2663532 RepID=UPI0013D79E1A|nr:histidinol-phosphatase HisJ [Gracilibacillus sp. YIM 98692]
MKQNGDYHVHTPFCPHGSNDRLHQYIEKAIEKGLQEITFTEHAPLPHAFQDPTPDKDSAMNWDDMESYIQSIRDCQHAYKGDIKINLGFEVDYIEGYEKDITQFLSEYGPYIEDAILSVHMLKTPKNQYVCIDFSCDAFGDIIKQFGDIDIVYQKYYHTMEKAIQSDLGFYKPKRMGHINLIDKYQKVYTTKKSYQKEIYHLLDLIREKKMELDINTAGLYKEDCGDIYPPVDIIRFADQLDIPLISGSDSHTAKHIGRGFDQLPSHIPYSKPNSTKKS